MEFYRIILLVADRRCDPGPLRVYQEGVRERWRRHPRAFRRGGPDAILGQMSMWSNPASSVDGGIPILLHTECSCPAATDPHRWPA